MTRVWARQQQVAPSVEDEQMLMDGEGQVWKKTWGWPGLGLLNWKCLCTTEVEKDVNGVQESWSCGYRCGAMQPAREV